MTDEFEISSMVIVVFVAIHEYSHETKSKNIIIIITKHQQTRVSQL